MDLSSCHNNVLYTFCFNQWHRKKKSNIFNKLDYSIKNKDFTFVYFTLLIKTLKPFCDFCVQDCKNIQCTQAVAVEGWMNDICWTLSPLSDWWSYFVTAGNSSWEYYIEHVLGTRILGKTSNLCKQCWEDGSLNTGCLCIAAFALYSLPSANNLSRGCLLSIPVTCAR